jgi:hypothetical protein
VAGRDAASCMAEGHSRQRQGPAGWAVPRCCLLPLLLVASASKQHVPSSVLPLTQPDSYGYSRAARKLRDSA